jgi:quinol monooxygenase YgiN
MVISLLAAAAGTVLAVAGTIALASRCARTPRVDLIAWTCAVFGLAVALGAQAAGFAVGFGPTTFRAAQLGAEVIAVLGLVLGLAEVAARNLPARFAARLAVTAVGIVSLVILATDPLGPTAFSKTFPAASVYYQPIPNSLLMDVLAPFAALVALIAILVTGLRSRHDPAWRATLPAVAAAGVAALALSVPGLAELADNKLGMHTSVTGAFPVLCVLAAVLAWFAASQMSGIRLEVVHQASSGAPGAEDDWGRRGWTGEFDPLTDAGDPGQYAGNGSNGRYAGQQAYGSYPGQDPDTGYGRGADGAGYGNGADDARYGQSGYRRYGDDSGYGTPGADGDPDGMAPAADGRDGKALAGRPAIWQAGGLSDGGLAQQAGMRSGQPSMPAADDHEAWSRLFGQIAIYTLLEDCVDAFDELTEAVVEQVRAREPGTLVYIVHAVPSAPMQRILYEVYQDREAWEEHRRQPYIAKFEADRRPYVLATNVIELGLQRAKLSPFSSLDDLLTESGVMPAVGPGNGVPATSGVMPAVGPGRACEPGGPAAAGTQGAAGGTLSAGGLASAAPRSPGGAPPGTGRGQQRLP